MNDTENLYKNVAKDISLNNFYKALVECFFVVLCGYVAGRFNLISLRETRGLDVFVRTFALPSVIFLSLAQLKLSTVNWNFLGSILVAKSIVFGGVLLVTMCLIRPVRYEKLGLYAIFCTQSNDFALGYPILQALYGQNHPDYPFYIFLMAPISLAVLNPISYVFLEVGKFQKDKEDAEKLESGPAKKSEVVETSIESESSSRNPNEPCSNLPNEKSETPLKKAQAKKSEIKLCGTVFLNVICNPVMLMTVLGIIGNFIYNYVAFFAIVLEAFANVFSTTALFVLGIRMVGTMRKLKEDAFINLGILIITKLLVLPLVIRETVSLLRPGINASDTLDLSSFGFIYGTFPTAPLVFVLSTQYDVEIESMSCSLVICTFLSAPLMYISAKMIFMDFLPTDDYIKKIESFEFHLGLVGIVLGVWLFIIFLANKSFSKIPHKISAFLIISQVVLCIGVTLQPFVKNNLWFEYVQLSIVALGLYSSRLWTCILALTLVMLQSRSLCFVLKLIPYFVCIAWGVPAILVAAVCFSSFPDHPFGSLINPSFRYGVFQSVITLLVLAVSFVATCVCLILQHRYSRKFAKYLILINDINSRDMQEVNETNAGECSTIGDNSACCERRGEVTDIEEIVRNESRTVCNGDCEDEDGLCSSQFGCTDSQRELCEVTLKQYKEGAINADVDEDRQDRQLLRHIMLLLLLVTSMFVNLMLESWTLVVEDSISGVYIELLFLNVLLNTGQITLSFAVFGFDSRGLIVALGNKWRKFYYGADTIVLTPVEELGFETTHVCHQFIAHHLRECEKDIAKNKRLRLRIYKGCFKGQTLVAWLQTKHLAKNEAEAIQYASHLLEGRVLRHVENRHYFENSDLLYTFKQ